MNRNYSTALAALIVMFTAALAAPAVLAQQSAPTASLAVSRLIATEDTGAPVIITVQLDQVATQDLPIILDLVGGNATPGADFMPPANAPIVRAGSRTASVELRIRDDDVVEGDERILVALLPGAGYQTGMPRLLEILIRDDDADSGDLRQRLQTLIENTPDPVVASQIETLARICATGAPPPASELAARCARLRLALIDPAEARRLVDSLRGLVAEELSSQRRGFRMIANGQLGNISRRLEAVRFGQGSGISLAGLTIADQALPLDMLGTGGDGVGAEGSDDGLLGRGLGLFLTGVVGRGERDASDLESGFQTDSHSLLLGVDQRFGSQWVAGAALSASRFDSDLDDAAGTLDMDLESVLVYASYSLGQGWIDGSLGVGRGDLEQLRNVSFETTTDEGSVSSTDVLRARSDVDLTSASLSAGYDFQRGGWRFGPRLALEYANLELDGYTEQAVQGSDSFAVQIDRQELRSLLVRAGLGLSGVISTSRAVLVPQFEIQYVSQLEDDVVPLRGRFVNDPMAQPFLLPTSAVDDSNGEFSLGLSAIFPNGRSAYFSYRRQFAATGIEQYFISAGARFEF